MKTKTMTLWLAAGLGGLCLHANGQSLLSTLSESTYGGCWTVGNADLAQEFTTGSQGATVGSVTVEFGTTGGGGGGSGFGLAFYSDSSGQPGSIISNGTLTGPTTPVQGLTTYDATDLTLAANTTYFLMFESLNKQYMNIQYGTYDPTSGAGWTLQNMYWWSSSEFESYGQSSPAMFSINGTAPVPEPTVLAFSGMAGAAGCCLWFRRGRQPTRAVVRK